MTANWLARTAIATIVSTSAVVAVPLAQAAQTCFNGFSNKVHYNFALAPSKFSTPGTYAAPGVIFGSLAPCAGLSKWPIAGTVTVTDTSVVLAFRSFTMDAAGCGATDNIVAMTPTSLNGTLQLHNDRNDVSNTTAFSKGACHAPPPEGIVAAAAAPGHDPNGN